MVVVLEIAISLSKTGAMPFVEMRPSRLVEEFVIRRILSDPCIEGLGETRSEGNFRSGSSDPAKNASKPEDANVKIVPLIARPCDEDSAGVLSLLAITVFGENPVIVRTCL